MLESLDRLMLAGLGMLSMTRQKAEEIFDEYVRRGMAERAGRTGFVQEMVETAERTRAELQKLVADQVRQAVEALHLASREDVQRLEKKLDELLQREK